MTPKPASIEDKRARLAALLQKRTAKPKTYPLSLAQERLWFLDRFEPNNSTYNIPGVIRITGALDVESLERAINAVVRRHEILRTVFSETNAGPVQLVQPFSPIALKVVSLEAGGPEGEERQVRYWIEQVCGAPFNLRTGPLVRACLLRVAPEDHVFINVVHHIICDGWSLEIFVREVEAFYRELQAGSQASSAELPIQYGDYARWQRQSAEEPARQLAFWKERLSDAPLVLPFPTDFPRPPVQTYSGASIGFFISGEVTAALKKVAREAEATMFMVLFAAFNAFLFRYTAQTDIVVGTSIANRGRKEVEGLIGLFVNTLPLRTRLSGSQGFSQLVRHVRDAAIEAYAHQDAPFDRLIQELQVKREMSYSPIFQVMFDLNAAAPDVKISGAQFKAMDPLNRTSKYDFTIAMQEAGSVLGGMLEFNTDLFERETAERMVEYWQRLLDWLVRFPKRPLWEIPLLAREQEEFISALEDETTLVIGEKERLATL
jgi:hypothetical protein